jgi:hypothetical protein
VRPEEAGPQISLKHPRGNPPASSSISRIPLETISGVGRISNRDAAVTPANLGNAARRFKTSAGSFFEANTTAPHQGAEEANADIQGPLIFRERRGGWPRLRIAYSLFIRCWIFSSRREKLSRGRCYWRE